MRIVAEIPWGEGVKRQREFCEFFLPHSHLTPSLAVNPVEFLDKIFNAKTTVLGLSVADDF